MPGYNIKLSSGNFFIRSLTSKKRFYYIFFFCCFFISGVFAQDQKVADSLARIYRRHTPEDTARLELLLNLSFNEIRDYNLAIKYADELITLSQQSHNDRYLRAGYFIKGTKERLLGNLSEALDAFFKSAELAKKLHRLTAEGDAYSAIADVYSVANNHQTAKYYYNKAITVLRQSNDSISLASAISNAGDEFLKIKNFDSALLYFKEAQVIFIKVHDSTGIAYSLGNMGMVYANTGKNDLAEKNINDAIHILEEAQNYYPICDYLISMSDVYLNKGNLQTAMNYASRSLQLAEQYGLREQIAQAYLKLSVLQEKSGDAVQSLKYYKSYILYRDSLNNIKAVEEMADLRTAYEVSQKQAEVNRLNQQKRNQRNVVISLCIILCLAIIILFILLNYNRSKQKAYEILNKQKQETDEQKAKAEKALNELQITQKQLIQSEKMASLAQLTAGIAHEIQNPLNFVNNFSEVSVELLGELIERTLSKLNASERAEADEIINDLAENLKKIGHHGKRADSIVKSMLQHSRVSSNKRELTDINTLSDEYLRLSYHGWRAKDNTFDISIETSFDSSLEKLSIIPQDVGRVLVNLYNNAFYSVQQKMKLNLKDYEPKLFLATKGLVKDGHLKAVQIVIKDNGIGIPDKILNKIYQPFFTTKPTGQGIGLGLFLSYDIITNEHQGQLTLETKEGEYAEFIIELPNKK